MLCGAFSIIYDVYRVYINEYPVSDISKINNISGFSVSCSMMQQSNGSIHPKINQKLHQNDMQRLQSYPVKSMVANQNIDNIPRGNIMMFSIET